jgi:hypothetical protein
MPLLERKNSHGHAEAVSWPPLARDRLSLGGFVLLTDYEQERHAAIAFAGHGVYTYDPKEDRYSLHWFDCIGSPPEVFAGGFDGDVLTVAHGGPGKVEGPVRGGIRTRLSVLHTIIAR